MGMSGPVPATTTPFAKAAALVAAYPTVSQVPGMVVGKRHEIESEIRQEAHNLGAHRVWTASVARSRLWRQPRSPEGYLVVRGQAASIHVGQYRHLEVGERDIRTVQHRTEAPERLVPTDSGILLD